MDDFAGLDVSVRETSVCIADETCEDFPGSEVGERARRVGGGVRGPRLPLQADRMEAGPLSQWLFSALAEAGLRDLRRDAAHAGGAEGADQQD